MNKQTVILSLALIGLCGLFLGASWDVGGVVNSVSTPTIITTTTNAVALASIDATNAPTRARVRLLQNVGTVPVIYALGSTAATTNYHGVLSAGTVLRDGKGGSINLSDWRGSVSVAVESGTGVVATLEFTKIPGEVR